MADFDPTKLAVDLNKLTISEVEMIEDITGEPIDALGKPGAKKGRMMRAMAYVVMRRDNPDITLDEVGDLTLVTPEGEGDPTEGAAPPPSHE